MSGETIRTVGDGWTWMNDYAFSFAEWTLNIPEGRECEVGTGIMAFGRPRGSRKVFSRHLEVTTFGIGAIHVRAADGKGPCNVRLDLGKVGMITIASGKL